jgi:FixJ family two-component response regulator
MITDHSMPKVTGVELVNKLHAAGTKLAVVLLTGEFRTTSSIDIPGLKIS